jgi:FkbM family methyltransferase
MILSFYFKGIGLNSITYFDIGANHPKKFSNTYFFYRYFNSRGVIVEPNPALHSLLKNQRRGDLLIPSGIGVGEEEVIAEYYEMDWHEFNTFSKKVAYETQEKYAGRNNVKKVHKLKLIPISDLMEKYFKNGLDLLTIDVEGMDQEILEAIDFNRYRPRAICVETKVLGSNIIDEMNEFMSKRGYRLYAITPINGIYIDARNQENVILDK